MSEHVFEFFSGETFKVNASGHISRACLGWAYSGRWRITALVRHNNFGRIVARVPFERFAEFIASNPQWSFKNGNPRWTVEDMDHGTARVWGNGIMYLRHAKG